MADIGTAIRQFLVSDATVSGLVDTRIYPDLLPQGISMPAVTYYRISTRHEGNINGSKAGIATTRIQIDAFATTRAGSNSLSEAIRKSGILDLGYTTTNGVDILAVEIDAGQRHLIEHPSDGTDQARYVTSQDYAFVFREDF